VFSTVSGLKVKTSGSEVSTPARTQPTMVQPKVPTRVKFSTRSPLVEEAMGLSIRRVWVSPCTKSTGLPKSTVSSSRAASKSL
jgi:hypothetical protein